MATCADTSPSRPDVLLVKARRRTFAARGGAPQHEPGGPAAGLATRSRERNQSGEREEDMSAETTPRPASSVFAPDAEAWPAGHRRPRMQGRVVFVTGGTRGIGAAISRSFAEQGAVVAAGYGRDRDHAQRLPAQLHDHGVEASLHQGNIASPEDCRRVVSEVIDAHGRIDVLVNNAGITIDKTVLKLTDEDWYKVLA